MSAAVPKETKKAYRRKEAVEVNPQPDPLSLENEIKMKHILLAGII
jgi:hypothetical protein